MNNQSKINWVEIVSVAIALIALIASFRACSISQDATEEANKSNLIAEKALNFSKKSFISENRPYLMLQPVRDKNTGFFVETILGEKETTLKGNFEIHNAGSSVAKDIRTKGIVVMSKNIKLSEDFASNIQTLPKISLGPGEKRNMGFNVRLGFSALSQGKNSKSPPGEAEAESIRLKVTIPLTYSSDLDSKDFRTTVTYEFPSFKEAYLVESIYE